MTGDYCVTLLKGEQENKSKAGAGDGRDDDKKCDSNDAAIGGGSGGQAGHIGSGARPKTVVVG